MTDTSTEAVKRYDWQPIETAPRDGTRVLVARCHVDSRPITWVTSAWVCQRHDKWTTGDPIEGCCGLIPPTHWMPLPDPPEKTPDR